jgi:branched-chain amino acid transport system permease protein
MEKFLDVTITGLLMGGLYALIAMGLSLQYGVARVLNVAHGDFIMLGGLTTWSLYTIFHINPLLCIVIAGPLAFILGFIVHRTIFRHLLTGSPVLGEISFFGAIIAIVIFLSKRNIPAAVIVLLVAVALDFLLNKTVFKRMKSSPSSISVFESNSLMVSFGLSYILLNVAFIGWNPDIRGYNYLQRPVDIGGALFGENRLITLGFAVLIGVIFYLFLARTRLGKAIRAAASDPTTASLMGVNINMVLALCFGLGAALAGIAGVLISMCYPVHAGMGMEYTMIALIIVVLGGLGSIPGSFIGGFVLGIIGSIVSFNVPGLVIAAYYLIFILLLLVRPKGILGK